MVPSLLSASTQKHVTYSQAGYRGRVDPWPVAQTCLEPTRTKCMVLFCIRQLFGTTRPTIYKKIALFFQ